jgi:hypothetical protein
MMGGMPMPVATGMMTLGMFMPVRANLVMVDQARRRA